MSRIVDIIGIIARGLARMEHKQQRGELAFSEYCYNILHVLILDSTRISIDRDLLPQPIPICLLDHDLVIDDYDRNRSAQIELYIELDDRVSNVVCALIFNGINCCKTS